MKFSEIFPWIKKDIGFSQTPEIFFLKSCWETFPIQENSNSSTEKDSDSASGRNLVSWPYLLYRLLFMGYFVSTKISNLSCQENVEFYFIFLTNWTYWVQVIYSVLNASNLIWVKFLRGDSENGLSLSSSKVTIVAVDNANSETYIGNQSLNLLEKVIWIFFNLVNVVPYGVTIIYWGMLYNGPSGSTCSIIHNFITHAFNSVFAFLDNFIAGIPIHITHMIFPMIYGLIYIIFTILYEVTNGRYPGTNEFIYSIINWRNSPGPAAITCILGIFVIAFAHLIFNFGIYKFRLWLTKCVSAKQELRLQTIST